MKEEHEALQELANDTIRSVIDAIRTATAEKPLTLFNSEDENLEDEIYDYPYGYFVSKHSFYIQGQVMSVKGDEVVLFLTGEDWGDLHHTELSQLPFESLVDLLSYLED